MTKAKRTKRETGKMAKAALETSSSSTATADFGSRLSLMMRRGFVVTINVSMVVSVRLRRFLPLANNIFARAVAFVMASVVSFVIAFVVAFKLSFVVVFVSALVVSCGVISPFALIVSLTFLFAVPFVVSTFLSVAASFAVSFFVVVFVAIFASTADVAVAEWLVKLPLHVMLLTDDLHNKHDVMVT